MDKISLLFSANKGLAPKPFKQIASGGELSRLMLSVKHLLAQKRAMPTLILDEIDTGGSGEVAFQMANMLRQMGQAHQIIAITHLPQIAAAGRQHWFVYKNHQGEKTVSSIRCLTEEDRVDEIAKMIGGQNHDNYTISNGKNIKIIDFKSKKNTFETDSTFFESFFHLKT